MTGSSYRCIELISEARLLYEAARYAECLTIIERVRHCTQQCDEGEACAAALRIASRTMTFDELARTPCPSC
ncbi:MAG: hypothetical protein Q7R40_00690 [Phaeospirillum sp.]|nr:hypothetical protein [Phaeospirillum sp.]